MNATRLTSAISIILILLAYTFFHIDQTFAQGSQLVRDLVEDMHYEYSKRADSGMKYVSGTWIEDVVVCFYGLSKSQEDKVYDRSTNIFDQFGIEIDRCDGAFDKRQNLVIAIIDDLNKYNHRPGFLGEYLRDNQSIFTDNWIHKFRIGLISRYESTSYMGKSYPMKKVIIAHRDYYWTKNGKKKINSIYNLADYIIYTSLYRYNPVRQSVVESLLVGPEIDVTKEKPSLAKFDRAIVGIVYSEKYRGKVMTPEFIKALSKDVAFAFSAMDNQENQLD